MRRTRRVFAVRCISLVLIPEWGTRASQQLLIALAAAGAIAASIPLVRQRLSHSVGIAAVAAAVVLALAVGSIVIDVPWEVIAYGRRIAPILRAADLYPALNQSPKVLFRGEGINSSVLILERSGQRHFYVSGKAEASTAPQHGLERMRGTTALITRIPVQC